VTAAVRCAPLTESSVVVEFGDRIDGAILDRVWALARSLDRQPVPGMLEYATGYTTVTVFFDPAAVDVVRVCADVERLTRQLDLSANPLSRTIEIPICYDAEFGPDLESVAEHNGLSVEQVIELHLAAEYLVYLIGFVPGFPYLGGMSPRLATPRLASPRPRVPAGSVAIGGEQTGIYPLSTPGGWRLIGRTPLTLFDPLQSPPCLLMPGDRVLFRRIERDEFATKASGGGVGSVCGSNDS
jgi:inhibitor of KinA